MSEIINGVLSETLLNEIAEDLGITPGQLRENPVFRVLKGRVLLTYPLKTTPPEFEEGHLCQMGGKTITGDATTPENLFLETGLQASFTLNQFAQIRFDSLVELSKYRMRWVSTSNPNNRYKISYYLEGLAMTDLDTEIVDEDDNVFSEWILLDEPVITSVVRWECTTFDTASKLNLLDLWGKRV